MKTITQETITGQVQSIEAAKNDYLIEFVIKTVRDGEVAWFNATATGWKAWNLKAGDKVSLTGQLTSTIWEDPFENLMLETFEMNASSLNRLAA